MDLRLLHPTLFRALASRRRMAILRTLGERPHTPAELARRLGVTEPTIQYHLDRLAAAGLAGRRSDGRPWAYHHLTPEGRGVVDSAPRSAPLAALAAASLALAGVSFLLWRSGRPAPLPPGTIGFPVPAPWWLAPAGWVAVTLAALGVALATAWLLARQAASLPEPAAAR